MILLRSVIIKELSSEEEAFPTQTTILILTLVVYSEELE